MTKRQKQFNIEGMTCAACSAAVERAVSRRDGISSANVNLTTEKMKVFFDSDIISENDIMEAVKRAAIRLYPMKRRQSLNSTCRE